MSLFQDEQRRLFLRRALQAGLWTTAGSSGLIAPLVHALDRFPSQLGAGKSVHSLRGEVKVDGKKADENTFITASSAIETGSSSYIIFAIGKDAHILRENSRIQFSNGRGSVSVKEEENILVDGLRLLTGKLLSVFGERRSSQKTYSLRTTTATIGIRGTGVYAESDPDVSYVCTCYGKTEIRSEKNPEQKEDIVSMHHDAPRYIAADGKQLITPAPMKNHTDEELMLIEALVGREAPISSIGGYKSPRKGY